MLLNSGGFFLSETGNFDLQFFQIGKTQRINNMFLCKKGCTRVVAFLALQQVLCTRHPSNEMKLFHSKSPLLGGVGKMCVITMLGENSTLKMRGI